MSALRIRLSLRGCTNRPFYHLVVANSKWKRDGKHLEQVCQETSPLASLSSQLALATSTHLQRNHFSHVMTVGVVTVNPRKKSLLKMV